jgi:hypothetical protein
MEEMNQEEFTADMFDLDAALRTVADTMIAAGLEQLTNTGTVTPLASFHCLLQGKLKTYVQEIPALLMGSGFAKDIVFQTLRRMTEACDARMVAILTDAYMFQANEKGKELMFGDKAKWQEKMDKGFTTLIKEGYGDRMEALQITVQTPHKVLLASRPYVRNQQGQVLLLTEAEAASVFKNVILPADQFSGRTKMFGPMEADVFDNPAMAEALHKAGKPSA